MNKQVIHYITSNRLVPVIVSVSGIVNLDRQPNFLQSTGTQRSCAACTIQIHIWCCYSLFIILQRMTPPPSPWSSLSS